MTYVIRVDPNGTVTEYPDTDTDLLTVALEWFTGAGTGLIDVVSMPTPAGAPPEFPQTGEHLVACVHEWGSQELAAVNPKVWALYGRSPVLGTAFVANDPYDDDGSRHPLPAEFIAAMRTDWVRPPLVNVDAMRHISRHYEWPS